MTTLRPIKALPAISLRNLTPSGVAGALPQLVFVSPLEIHVEPEYQRDLSERSIRLIRKIIGRWRWAHIKPVICARVGDKFAAIDGQHTAIAAATLGIAKIPAMIVPAISARERAEAFIGQNCDRLQLTAAHMHFAGVAAGEEICVAVDEACRKADVTILRHPKGAVPYKVGETMAVGFIRGLVKERGVNFAARVMKILVEAKRAPLHAAEIAAVSMLLRAPEYAGKVDSFDLVTALRSASPETWLARAAGRVAKGATRRAALAETLFAQMSRSKAA